MTDPFDSRERRQFPRAPIGVIIRVKTDKGTRHYYSKDLSASGVFLLAEEPLEKETKLVLEMFLPLITTPVQASGKVVWVKNQEPTGFAVKFTEISPGSQKLIRWVVERYLGQGKEE